MLDCLVKPFAYVFQNGPIYVFLLFRSGRWAHNSTIAKCFPNTVWDSVVILWDLVVAELK